MCKKDGVSNNRGGEGWVVSTRGIEESWEEMVHER